jgi:hypothetical protein
VSALPQPKRIARVTVTKLGRGQGVEVKVYDGSRLVHSEWTQGITYGEKLGLVRRYVGDDAVMV